MSTDKKSQTVFSKLMAAICRYHRVDETDIDSTAPYARVLEDVVLNPAFDLCVLMLEHAIFAEASQETSLFRADQRTKTFFRNYEEMERCIFLNVQEILMKQGQSIDSARFVFAATLVAYHVPLCWRDLTRDELAFLNETQPLLFEALGVGVVRIWEGSPRPFEEPLDALSRAIVVLLLRTKGGWTPWWEAPPPPVDPPLNAEPPEENKTPPVGGVIFRA